MPPKQEITQQKILDAAFGLVRSQGIEAVTARNVAERLKCSTQPIYSAFTSMEELKFRAYERALFHAQQRIHAYRDDRFIPPLCLAVGYLDLANSEKQLFRSVYLSGFSARHARANLHIGREMIAAHRPNSNRLVNADPDALERIYSKISVYIAGLGAMINTGALAYSTGEAAEQVKDLYETIVTGELARPHQPPQKVALGQLLGSGANADVYEYGPGKVVKLYRTAHGVGQRREELTRHRFAEQTCVTLPHLYESVDIDGLPGLVFERIDGETIAGRLMGTMDDKYVRQLAGVVHAIHLAPAGHLDHSGIPSVHDSVAWQIDHGTGLADEEKEAVKRLLASLPGGECLCHGDLNPMNIILRGDEPVAIDWQGACIGNPTYDAVQVMLIFKYADLEPERFPAGFVGRFEAARSGLNSVFCTEYCRLSGSTQAELDAWLIPAAAARLHSDINGRERENLLGAIRGRINF